MGGAVRLEFVIPREAAALQSKLFQRENGAADYYRLANFGDAIGLPVDRFALGSEEPASAVPDAPATAAQPIPGVAFVAASIEGAIEGDAAALRSPFLAIARGGRVIAVAKRFDKDGKSRFHAIVAPEFVAAEGDELRFYSITQEDPDGAGMRLFPLRPRATAETAR